VVVSLLVQIQFLVQLPLWEEVKEVLVHQLHPMELLVVLEEAPVMDLVDLQVMLLLDLVAAVKQIKDFLEVMLLLLVQAHP
jgi:hypothetical protein